MDLFPPDWRVRVVKPKKVMGLNIPHLEAHIERRDPGGKWEYVDRVSIWGPYETRAQAKLQGEKRLRVILASRPKSKAERIAELEQDLTKLDAAAVGGPGFTKASQRRHNALTRKLTRLRATAPRQRSQIAEHQILPFQE